MPDEVYVEGEHLPPWTLLHLLGVGGNSEVWRAQHENGTTAAVKFSTRKLTDTRYLRFKDEINLHLELGNLPGVLPMYDHYLPSNPSKRNPSWLSMPEATPIKEALGTPPDLSKVVQAVAEIAETLASLAERRVYHRDLKPSNLYYYSQHWVIGDLGLAHFGDKESETASTERLGPAYFHAPEMLTNPKTAAYGPADVYALAKTLTVLATEQQWPPFGQQRKGVKNEAIETWVGHPRVRYLDNLVEKATAADPSVRPTMRDMAKELRAWLTPLRDPIVPEELADVAEQMKSILEPKQQLVDARNALATEGELLARRIAQRLVPIRNSMAGIIPYTSQVEKDLKIQQTFDYGFVGGFGSPEVIYKTGYAFSVVSKGSRPVSIWCGFGLEVLSDAQLRLTAAYLIREPYDLLQDTRAIDNMQFEETIPVGSVREEHVADEIISMITRGLRPAAETFMSNLRVYPDA